MDAWIACPTCGGNGGRECGACFGEGGFEARPALTSNCAESYIHNAPDCCPWCFGFGEMGACPQCFGAGVLEPTDCAPIHTPKAVMRFVKYEQTYTCGMCNGWGESAEWGGSCPSCGGSMIESYFMPWESFPACVDLNGVARCTIPSAEEQADLLFSALRRLRDGIMDDGDEADAEVMSWDDVCDKWAQLRQERAALHVEVAIMGVVDRLGDLLLRSLWDTRAHPATATWPKTWWGL